MRSLFPRSLLAAGVTAALLLTPGTALASPPTTSAPDSWDVTTAQLQRTHDRAAGQVAPNALTTASAIETVGGAPSALYSVSTDSTGTVIRWNACAPIHYEVNVAAEPDALADVQEAVRQVGTASGLQFVYDGPSTQIPQRADATRSPQSGPPLLIAWANPSSGPNFSDLLDSSPGLLGVGGWAARAWNDANGMHPVQIVSGRVTMNAATSMTPGSAGGTAPSRVRVLMHEVSHAVGLNHVNDPAQVMNPYVDNRAAAWGAGDLTGLGRVGAAAGCIGAPAPAPAPVVAAGTAADLGVTVSIPPVLPIAQSVPVTVRVTNSGPTSSVPAETTLLTLGIGTFSDGGSGQVNGGNVTVRTPALAPGESAVYQLRLQTVAGFSIGAALVRVTPSTPDPNPANNWGLGLHVTW